VYKVIDSWTFGAKGDKSEVSETLYVNSGNQHLSAESPKVTVNLK
jgi:hypothetical protein